jgi:predicted acylesterase/phospholipase RssA
MVLGGGGSLGAFQAGVLHALAEAGILPDALFGCSVGALNAAILARGPSREQTARLVGWWADSRVHGILAPSLMRRVAGLAAVAATRSNALFDERPLRRLIAQHVPSHDISELAVPLVVTTTCLECGVAVHHQRGTPQDVLVASCALPGLFPATRLADGHHHVDGGIVCGVPIQAALDVAEPDDTILVLDCALAPVTSRPSRCAAVMPHPTDPYVCGIPLSAAPRHYQPPTESHRGPLQTMLAAFAVARSVASRAAVEAALADSRVHVLPHIADAWAAGLLDRLPSGPRDLSVTSQLLDAGQETARRWLATRDVAVMQGGPLGAPERQLADRDRELA